MTSVFRIEHKKTNEGPYRSSYLMSNDTHQRFHSLCWSLKRHPAPYADSGAWRHYRFRDQMSLVRFGFDTIEKLFDWFHVRDMLERFEREGFEIVLYELNDDADAIVYDDGKQIAFQFDKAQRVGECAPTFALKCCGQEMYRPLTEEELDELDEG